MAQYNTWHTGLRMMRSYITICVHRNIILRGKGKRGEKYMTYPYYILYSSCMCMTEHKPSTLLCRHVGLYDV